MVAGGLTLAILVGLLLVRGSSTGVSYAGDLRVGGTLEKLILPRLEGSGTISYADYRSKPLVINFFASWCPNCIGEMPGFQQVHSQLGGRVAFLGISQSDSRSASIQLAQKTGVRYATGIDERGQFFAAIGGTAMPITVFVQPGGRIAYINVGALDPATLRSDIGTYLGVTS